MKKLKQQNAITLVALVITIIILLILAAISIQALTSTGLFGQAKQAKTEHEIAREKEQIKMAIMAEMANINNNNTLTYDGLKKELEVYKDINNVENVNDIPSNATIVSKSNKKFELKDLFITTSYAAENNEYAKVTYTSKRIYYVEIKGDKIGTIYEDPNNKKINNSEGEQHKISFNPDGGTEIPPMDLNAGDKITLPTLPSKDDEEFDGWKDDQNNLYKPGDIFTMPNSDVTLTAQYSPPIMLGFGNFIQSITNMASKAKKVTFCDESVPTEVTDTMKLGGNSIGNDDSILGWYVGDELFISPSDTNRGKKIHANYDCSGMFRSTNLDSIDFTNLDTSWTTKMSNMFNGSTITNLSLSNLNVSNVTDMSYMFNGATINEIDLSNLDTSNVTNMSYMFYEATIQNLDISSLNTSKVEKMDSMFSNFTTSSNLSITKFDFSQVNSMKQMLLGVNCKDLTISNVNNEKNINLSDFLLNATCVNLIISDFYARNASNVSCFATITCENCYINNMAIPLSIKLLDIKSTVNNIEINNFEQLLSGECYWFIHRYNSNTSINKIKINNFSAPECTSLYQMLYMVNSKSIEINGFSAPKCTSFLQGLYGNNNLTSLTMKNINLPSLETLSYAFYNCSSLTELDLSDFSAAKVKNIDCICNMCTNLTKFKINPDLIDSTNIVFEHTDFYGCGSTEPVYIYPPRQQGVDHDIIDDMISANESNNLKRAE